MSSESIILTLLAFIGGLLVFVGGFYINSVEGKFDKLEAKIDNLTKIVGMRKVSGSIEHRQKGE